MPKFIALQSVGAFLPGDEIKGLNDDRIQALLASGAIEEYKPPEQTPSDDSQGQLQQLAAEIADLKADNQLLSDDKVKADAEIADLKAQVAELDKQLKAATAKKPATKTADDAK
ncbi:hypothetical protein [uncultured Acinetobacter sp.]|uniref:hypothetical protein n=1 Tax=uncultured Acinetobacter sp. TaxID=165433 RepID=UPI00258E4387|nr:hypothetical protein [uncultured Acinetobacter sp.]